MIELEINIMNKVGALFLKLSDAYNLLSKEEKDLLIECFPIGGPYTRDFFLYLEKGFAKGGQLKMRDMSGMKDRDEKGWVAFCEEEGFDYEGEELENTPPLEKDKQEN